MASNPPASWVVHATHKYHKQHSAHSKCQSDREFIVDSSELNPHREDVKVEIAAVYHRLPEGKKRGNGVFVW